MFRIPFLIGTSVLASLAAAGLASLVKAHKTWGVIAEDAQRELPGDDLVPEPSVVETRSLVIDAAPAAVWPWLVQMGYERGGWYSYDRLDMKGSSAREIKPELQSLDVGDIVPTHPEGGFVAKVVDGGKALVLYLDTEELARQDEEAAIIERDGNDDPTQAGLQLARTMGDSTMPDFEFSWAFVLEPEPDGKTRLIERFRVRTVATGLAPRLGMPLMGYGVFAMARKQMLGIKERAEASPSAAPSRPAPETGIAEPAGA